MVAVKAHLARAFLKSIDRTVVAVLIYGTDEGLIAETAAVAAKALSARENPPGEIIRLADADLENEPDRLSIEVETIAMFGGRKVVRVELGRRLTASAVAALVERGAPASCLVVEAGNLKPTDAIRKVFEKLDFCAALPCYPDEARDLEAVVREVLDGHRLAIDPDARTALLARLGADRALSRGEVEKLALYCTGRRSVTLDDVEAIVGDASELQVDRIVNAALAGETGRALAEWDRAVSAGESPQGVLGALQRSLQRLHRIRVRMDAGGSADDALRDLRPPLHFKQRDAVLRQAKLWSSRQLAAGLRRASEVTAACRRSGHLEEARIEALLIALSQAAAPGARQRR